MSDKTLNVLLIEDNSGDVRLLKETLAEAQEARLELVQVARLEEGLRQLEQTPFDVVLLDLSLPDSQGFETFNRVHVLAPDLPVIVLTVTNDETLALKAVQLGAQDYLIKGQTDANLLLRAIRYAIERQRLLIQLQAEYRQKQAQQQREQSSWERLQTTPTTVTAHMFGIAPLSESLPDTFWRLVNEYGTLMDRVLEANMYKVETSVSNELRAIAEYIGFVQGGPRDVIEIHSAALKRKMERASPQKAQAYIEEARLMVLELMGYLVAYYRNYSLGARKPSKPGGTPQPGNPGKGHHDE